MIADAEMADPDTQASGQDAGELDEALLRAISHPLRHRLLGMLDGRTASPNQLARELGLPLGRVSYHIRLLNDLGAIELVGTEPRRGALEHFYRAVTTVWFNEADWSKLPRSARRGILGQNLQHIFASVTKAADSGGFDNTGQRRHARPARARRGRPCTELSELLNDSIDRAREINARAAERRSAGTTATSIRPSWRFCTSSGPHKLTGMAGLRRALVAIAAALALADASIVALALPPTARRVRHDDHRRGGGRRRLRARAGDRDPARAPAAPGPDRAVRVRGRVGGLRARAIAVRCCWCSARCRRPARPRRC